MYPVLSKEKLSENIYRFVVEAENVSRHCLPGQFLIVKTFENSERIPLTICDYDREKKTVTIVVQTAGFSTQLMTELENGDAFYDVVGPLGKPSELTGQTPEELAEKKIYVNAIAPGMTQTEMLEDFLQNNGEDSESYRKITDRQYLGIGNPEDVANVIVFLLSSSSKFISGAIVPVDGGYTTC